MDGTVKWFDKRKGYGFIESENGTEVFVHYTSFADGLNTLDEGQQVSFEIVEGEKGPRADNVTLKENQTAQSDT
jgi:CspA family cold shock protein